MDQVRALSVFMAVVEHGNFNQAAIQQGMTPQAVSKSVKQLEHELGVRLFQRTTRKSSLTQEGQRLLESVRPNLDGLAEALTALRASTADDAGLVRITADGPLGRKVLMPVIAEFMQAHPRISIELLLEGGFTDLVKQRIDLGFRAGSQPEGEVIARKLFALQQVICAAPAYLARHGAPASLDELERHRCTALRLLSTGRLIPWELRSGDEVVHWTPQAVFCVNDTEAELEAVLAGIALGQIDSVNASAPLRSGALRAVLPQHSSASQAVYLYYAQRRNMPRRVRLFIDFAVHQLQSHPDFAPDSPNH
jgi:DNA-binding transcriptional LysR family regulator